MTARSPLDELQAALEGAALSLPAHDRPSACAALLGAAAAAIELPPAELQRLVTRHRRARLFCRTTFAAAALGGDARTTLRVAWLLHGSGALRFEHEYLAAAGARAGGAEALGRELLGLCSAADECLPELLSALACAAFPALPSGSDAEPAPPEAAATARVALTAAASAARAADDRTAWLRLLSAAGLSAVQAGRCERASLHSALEAQLSLLLAGPPWSESASTPSPLDLRLLYALAAGLGEANSLRLCLSRGCGAAAGALLRAAPSLAAAAEAQLTETAAAALGAHDATAAASCLGCASACLEGEEEGPLTTPAAPPSSAYALWLARLLSRAQAAGDGSRQCLTLIDALIVRLPSDGAAALSAHSSALKPLASGRLASRVAEYSASAFARRRHLRGGAGAGAGMGLGAAGDPEDEVRRLVAAFAAAGRLAMPPALAGVVLGNRMAWFSDRIAPRLIAPRDAPVLLEDDRRALIRALARAAALPAAAEAEFDRRCAAMRLGGPAVASLLDAGAAWAAALRSGQPTAVAAAARDFGIAADAAVRLPADAAAVAAAGPATEPAAAGARAPDRVLRDVISRVLSAVTEAWGEAGGVGSGARAGRRALAAEAARWPPALRDALHASILSRLAGPVLRGAGPMAVGPIVEASPPLDAAASLLLHLAALRCPPFADAARLTDALVPATAARSPAEAVRAARAGGALLRAAAAEGWPRWAGEEAAEELRAEAPPPAPWLPLPLLARMEWLRQLLAGGPAGAEGRAVAAAALASALGPWRAHVAEPTAAMHAEMGAGRLQF